MRLRHYRRPLGNVRIVALETLKLATLAAPASCGLAMNATLPIGTDPGMTLHTKLLRLVARNLRALERHHLMRTRPVRMADLTLLHFFHVLESGGLIGEGFRDP